MEQIIPIAVQAIFGIVMLALVAILAKARQQIEQREATKDEQDWLDSVIYALVCAAEQTLKIGDPDGHKRKSYVVEQLNALGVAITDLVNAKIEAAVYEINEAQE